MQRLTCCYGLDYGAEGLWSEGGVPQSWSWWGGGGRRPQRTSVVDSRAFVRFFFSFLLIQKLECVCCMFISVCFTQISHAYCRKVRLSAVWCSGPKRWLSPVAWYPFKRHMDKVECDQAGPECGKGLKDPTGWTAEITGDISRKGNSVAITNLKGCHVEQGPALPWWPQRAGPRKSQEDSSWPF